MANPDPRIERTRRAIIQAAREVLLEDGDESVSLTAIATRAGYSRRAAYANFTDLAGILLAVAVDALELAEPPDLPPDELRADGVLRDRIHRLLEQIEAERPLLRRISAFAGSPALGDALWHTARRIFERAGEGLGLTIEDDVVVVFVTGGFVTLAREWIVGTLPATTDSLTESVMTIIGVIRLGVDAAE